MGYTDLDQLAINTIRILAVGRSPLHAGSWSLSRIFMAPLQCFTQCITSLNIG